MFVSRCFIGKLYLLSICWNVATAVPVVEPNGRMDTHGNAADTIKRAPGDSRREPKPVTFNTNRWEDSAEYNCYVMLCIKRTRTL